MNRVIDTVFDNNFAAAVLFSPAESLLLESERFRYQMAKDFTPSSRNREAFEAMTDTVGNVPPQAVELEEAVLGALMLEKDSIISVQEYVTPEAFYTEEHRLIYKAINELSMELKPIDLYTVTERLKVKKELQEGGRRLVSRAADPEGRFGGATSSSTPRSSPRNTSSAS